MNNEFWSLSPFIIFFIIWFLMIIILNVFKKIGTSNSKYTKFYKWSIVFLMLGFVGASMFCYIFTIVTLFRKKD